MTDPPIEHPHEPEGDPLSTIVEQFLFQFGKDPHLSVDAFCAGHPEDIREDLRQRCLEALRVQRTLEQLDSDETSPNEPSLERIGEFRLERILGRGSFGVVYLAWQESLARRVALKVLAVNPDVEARAVERFRREAVAAGKLRHPNIVSVHSVGEADGKLYLVMDFIDGPTLGKALEETKDEAASDIADVGAESGGSSCLGSASRRGYPGRVAGIIADLAEALQLAHDHDIIHRDVKPQNVLLDQGGNPFLADFGLAKDLNEMSLSRIGDQAGSPPYMSPEQALAKRIPIDHRTDVFSLGVVMYEMLALRRPFQGESLASLFYAISFKDPTRLRKLNPRVPRDLETICHKALQKNPDNRFQRAGDMAENLRRFLNHESIIIQAPRWYQSIWRSVMRHRVAACVAVVLVFGTVLTAIVATHVSQNKEIARMLDPIREFAAVTDLAALSPQRLLAAHRDAKRARDLIGELSDTDRALVVKQQNRLVEFGRSERRQGLAVIEQAFSPEDLRSTSDRLVDFTDGIRHLMTSSFLLPQEELQDLAHSDSWYPTISIDSIPNGAEVVLLKRDPVTDQVSGPQLLGKTPLTRKAVPPNHYRILIRNKGFGFVELDRAVDTPMRTYEFPVQRLRSNEDAQRGMVLIPKGEFVFGAGKKEDSYPYHQQTVDLPGFWIDEAEVSNAQYKEFVDSSGWKPPPIWPDPYDKRFDDLPVVAVKFFDAQAYCEWRGCRLPTLREWERAARGKNGSLYPRDPNEVDLDSYALLDENNRPPDPIPPGKEPFWEHNRKAFLGFAHSVRSHPEAAEETKLFHTLGNIREMTATLIFVRKDKNTLAPQPGSRWSKGGSYEIPPPAVNLSTLWSMPAEMWDRSVGFRCARSAIK